MRTRFDWDLLGLAGSCGDSFEGALEPPASSYVV